MRFVVRTEHALAGAEHQRVDHQKQLVDEPMWKQGADELTATHDYEVAAGLLSQRSHLGGDIAAQERGIGPGECGIRIGGGYVFPCLV